MYQKELNSYLSILQKEIHLLNQARFLQTKHFIQHGTTSVYSHCIGVAYVSCVIAAKFHLSVNVKKMIRGALLHDYFLYDWHEKDASHRLHGIFHPKKALTNAKMDFVITPMEQDIIVKHMFPLTILPPVYLEAWIVCMADKYCSVKETFASRF